MKSFYFLFILLAFSFRCKGQGKEILDKRQIFFYLFDVKSNQADRISKTLGRLSDSLIVSDIELLIEKTSNQYDTIRCIYVNNTIFFKKVDTSEIHIYNLLLSLKLNLKKKGAKYNEKIIIPFGTLFKQTNENSTLSLSLEQKKNNLYYISISKLDFPFITSSFYSASEVLELYRSKQIKQ